MPVGARPRLFQSRRIFFLPKILRRQPANIDSPAQALGLSLPKSPELAHSAFLPYQFGRQGDAWRSFRARQ